MKFIKLLKYVECSFEDKPSFVILMSDDKEYISNGCVFVENTQKNINSLIRIYDCKSYLEELFNSKEIDISEISNARYMFSGCISLTSFSSKLPLVTDARSMFYDCRELTSFSSELPMVTDDRYMFVGCKALTMKGGKNV